MVEYRGSFRAIDAAGAEVTLAWYVDVIAAPRDAGGRAAPARAGYLFAPDGREVVRFAKGMYETAGGVRLATTDRDAP